VIEPLLQHGPYVRLLVTSPSAAVAQKIGGREIWLREMQAKEAIELLLKTVEHEQFDRRLAGQVARVVGRHCQALSIAATLFNHSGRPIELLEDLANERSRLETLQVGRAEYPSIETEPGDAERWRSVRATLNVAYRRLNEGTQEHLRALGAIPSRLPYVDGELMAALMGQAGQVMVARNVLQGLAEFGIVEPMNTGELEERWGILRLSPQEDDEALYRIPVVWRGYAEDKARAAGELESVSQRRGQYTGGLRTFQWRCAIKPIPGMGKLRRWQEIWQAITLCWKTDDKVDETARQARLHGMLFDPLLRHLVYRMMYRNRRIIKRVGVVMAGLMMTASLLLAIVCGMTHLVKPDGWVLSFLIAMAAAACFSTAAALILYMAPMQWVETWRLMQWFSNVLVPLSLANPKERARRLEELGIANGNIWQAMVRDKAR